MIIRKIVTKCNYFGYILGYYENNYIYSNNNWQKVLRYGPACIIFVPYKNEIIMKAFRYNSENRSDRKYNNCGKEKNPNAVKFYASNMDYANNYKFIYNEDGEVVAECTLEVVDIEGVNLFGMTNNFKSLSTYNNYIASEIGAQMRDYTRFMNNAKKASERKMWAKHIDDLKNREQELISNLFCNEFQPLSDFERQNELVAELKALGFNGYATNNEIAIF